MQIMSVQIKLIPVEILRCCLAFSHDITGVVMDDILLLVMPTSDPIVCRCM